ncbi:MAG: diacylglycerol kinase family lipid kinase [Anaerolineaceae bacterium]|nr:diacylglycerol kinase family lipid kinase [Anaerolineaceae bacterium]
MSTSFGFARKNIFNRSTFNFFSFNKVFKEAGHDYDIVLTKERGDGCRLSKQAILDGADIVAAYGGDGTVMEVACGLQNSNIPMAIFPGGTGNILSIELGISQNIESACNLIIKPETSKIRVIDLGGTNDPDMPGFVLRAGVGLEADMLEGTDQELKEKFGIFAYIIGGMQALKEVKESLYHLVLDGQSIESKGLTCLIANAGFFGVPGLTLDPKVKVDDGLLDVFVIQKTDLAGLFSLAASVVSGTEKKDAAQHWQVKNVKIEAEPAQATQADGEMWGKSPIELTIQPNALQVIVPA